MMLCYLNDSFLSIAKRGHDEVLACSSEAAFTFM